MSPIYVRPEREQAEHDRLIRFLQAKYSRKFEAVANPGEERVAPMKVAAVTHFPDIVLSSDNRLAGVVEIETVASVNNLEAMAKWVPFARARVPFHLYVPVPGYEAAMRLVEAHRVKAAEIWTYRPATEGFDLVRMFVDAALEHAKPPRASKAPKSAAPKAAPAGKTAAPSRPPVVKKAATKPAAKTKAKAPARTAGKAIGTKARSKPAASRPAVKRPAAKRAAKPVRSPAKTAKTGGKKGTGARKSR